MYEHYFGLRERPFDLSPNPRFLFLSPKHAEALAHIRYGLSGRPGVTVLIGEAGTGKTTLVRAALQSKDPQPRPATIVQLSNPTLTRSEFYEYLSAGFGLSAAAAISKTRFLAELESLLGGDGDRQPVIALVVDEAQSLPHELLEEIRLLTNVQSVGGQSLTVVLAGQPELADRLNEGRLRQLKQRVALRCELVPLDLQETAAYISTRIRVAGGTPQLLFTREAVAAVYEHSQGIPRTISVICDNALVSGFAGDLKPIGRDIILEVSRDFGLGPAPAPAPVVTSKRTETVAPVTSTRPEDTQEPEGALFSRFTRGRRFFSF